MASSHCRWALSRAFPLVIALCASFASLISAIEPNTDFVVEDGFREIDVSSHIVTVRETLVIKHTGQKAAAGIILCTSQLLGERMAVMELRQHGLGRGGEVVLPTYAVDVRHAPEGVSCRAAVLSDILKSGDSAHLEAYATYNHMIVPFPKSRKHHEPQRMLLDDLLVILSPYEVQRQNVQIILPNNVVESYTKFPTPVLSGSSLLYGPIDRTKPWTMKSLQVHFQQPLPVIEVLRLEREIEVSHWGRLRVTDSYSMVYPAPPKSGGAGLQSLYRNGGAALEGEWSQGMLRDSSLIEALRFSLLHGAHKISYRDDPGNIASTEVIANDTKVEAFLRLRYPLPGGRGANFIFSYSVPTERYLWRTNTGQLKLSVPFVSPMADTIIDQFVIKVVLPEGSREIKPRIPISAKTSEEIRHSYFDVVARPVRVITMANFINQHPVNLDVQYLFEDKMMLLKPLLISATIILSSWMGAANETNPSSNHNSNSRIESVRALISTRTNLLAQLSRLASTISSTTLDDIASQKDELKCKLADSLAQLRHTTEGNALGAICKEIIAKLLDYESDLANKLLDATEGKHIMMMKGGMTEAAKKSHQSSREKIRGLQEHVESCRTELLNMLIGKEHVS